MLQKPLFDNVMMKAEDHWEILTIDVHESWTMTIFIPVTHEQEQSTCDSDCCTMVSGVRGVTPVTWSCSVSVGPGHHSDVLFFISISILHCHCCHTHVILENYGNNLCSVSYLIAKHIVRLWLIFTNHLVLVQWSQNESSGARSNMFMLFLIELAERGSEWQTI